MVILREDNLPPLCWRLARVEKVYPGGRIISFALFPCEHPMDFTTGLLLSYACYLLNSDSIVSFLILYRAIFYPTYI